ncbi:MAG: heat-inducible transcription repressor HrcA [Clostridia bacterium]|nr:heat-inducible transcription repressor HrcA [Clostridia bacterium]
MELSARKRAVLEAIVRAYIETGEPVGSKILTGLMENAPSSATLRNEMSELCELGYLEQPHISAGRIPTGNAYRLFVKSLMTPAEINDSTKEFIDSLLSQRAFDPESIHSAVADILYRLTGLTSFGYTVTDGEITVKRIELMGVSRHSVILFLITSDGRSKSRICRLAEPLSAELTERLKDIFEKLIKRRPLSELNKAYLQNIIALAGFDSFVLMPLLTSIFDMASEAAENKIFVAGESGMYNIFGEDKAGRVLSLVSRCEPIVNACEEYDGATEVIFGDDTSFNDLKGTAMVVCKYNISNKYCGRIGIIGSDRMSYEQIIPGVEYIASRLTDIMTEVQKDMED